MTKKASIGYNIRSPRVASFCTNIPLISNHKSFALERVELLCKDARFCLMARARTQGRPTGIFGAWRAKSPVDAPEAGGRIGVPTF
jgi:hypothetical protein